MACLMAVMLIVVQVVEARPKDKHDGKSDSTATETVPPEQTVPDAEQPLTAGNSGSSDEHTLLALDADGDYIPDALDNCPNTQNPDQADVDGDGNGDACNVYQDTDGDTVPDKQDNCPTVATSDFTDTDGDGVGNPCDKSPDGIEPTAEPAPSLDGQGGEGANDPPTPESGAGEDGQSLERAGHERSKQRERTDRTQPTITTNSDGDQSAETQTDEAPPAEPVRDNPRRNEELIAEAAASGELDAAPEPPPSPQKAWEEDTSTIDWQPIFRIDAGATGDAAAPNNADAAARSQESGGTRTGNAGAQRRNQPGPDASDSQFARGWMRAKLVLLDQAQKQSKTGDGDQSQGSVPVPVENGLVISGVTADETAVTSDAPDSGDQNRQTASREIVRSDAESLDGQVPTQEETLDGQVSAQKEQQKSSGNQSDKSGGHADGGSRRDGSSRAAAAPDPQQTNTRADQAKNDNGGNQDSGRQRKSQDGWSNDRFFDGGNALNWSGDLEVAGTDDDQLYLTQRSGSGPGKKRGFDYAIPIDSNGPVQVRLYFAEPYWGSPEGPEGGTGRRVFSVSAEGEVVLENLDVYDEAGALTALVKQFEVDVQDGELNLNFVASEGEPIVAGIEVLVPSS
jgi:hypothetical protein